MNFTQYKVFDTVNINNINIKTDDSALFETASMKSTPTEPDVKQSTIKDPTSRYKITEKELRERGMVLQLSFLEYIRKNRASEKEKKE